MLDPGFAACQVATARITDAISPVRTASTLTASDAGAVDVTCSDRLTSTEAEVISSSRPASARSVSDGHGEAHCLVRGLG